MARYYLKGEQNLLRQERYSSIQLPNPCCQPQETGDSLQPPPPLFFSQNPSNKTDTISFTLTLSSQAAGAPMLTKAIWLSLAIPKPVNRSGGYPSLWTLSVVWIPAAFSHSSALQTNLSLVGQSAEEGKADKAVWKFFIKKYLLVEILQSCRQLVGNNKRKIWGGKHPECCCLCMHTSVL